MSSPDLTLPHRSMRIWVLGGALLFWHKKRGAPSAAE